MEQAIKKLTYKMFVEEDYPMLMDWWKAHNWPNGVPLDGLSKTGIIVSIDNKYIVAGFLYTPGDGAKFCFIEWLIANPDTTSEERSEGIQALVDQLSTIAQINGCKYVYTMTNHPKLIKKYEDLGFIKADGNMTSLMRVL